jgi:hypothetical protein
MGTGVFVTLALVRLRLTVAPLARVNTKLCGAFSALGKRAAFSTSTPAWSAASALVPSTLTSWSPRIRPARSAGLPGST